MARPTTGKVLERTTNRGIVYALRFSANGQRQYVTLGSSADGWTRRRADLELQNVLADVRRGAWTKPDAQPAPERGAQTFHHFASEWFAGRAPELRPNTRAQYRWALTNHLLPYFRDHLLPDIDVELVDRYRAVKVDAHARYRELVSAPEPTGKTAREARREQVKKAKKGAIGPESINKTLKLLGQVLDVAEERGLIDRNPLRINASRRKVKVVKAPRVHLDRAEQITALLDAARELDREARADRQTLARGAMLATFLFAGLRVSELTALRWRDVDLGAGRIIIAESKTAAGHRQVTILPVLRDELTSHRARFDAPPPDAFVFPTTTGKQHGKDNVRNRVLKRAVDRANRNLVAVDRNPLPERLTPHGLRHTFCSVLIALGRDPKDVMEQIGHTDPAFTLRVYAHAMRRTDDERQQLDALVSGGPIDEASIVQVHPDKRKDLDVRAR